MGSCVCVSRTREESVLNESLHRFLLDDRLDERQSYACERERERDRRESCVGTRVFAYNTLLLLVSPFVFLLGFSWIEDLFASAALLSSTLSALLHPPTALSLMPLWLLVSESHHQERL